MQSPGIQVQNACLRYHNKLLFENLNFILPAGKITCLLGPSGVGKTSFLRMLAQLPCYDKLTQQSATIIASDKLPLTHRISYLAQTDLLLPWLSCLENIIVGYRLRQQLNKTVHQQALKLLELIKLENARDQYPAQLSGGMRQRVALARTLLEDQPIVLMDEPFSAIDTITRLQLQDLTAELLTGKTVLLITHDPLEALRLGHQIIIMSGCPATFSAPIILEQEPPRQFNNERLLHWQGILMQRLTQAKETTKC